MKQSSGSPLRPRITQDAGGIQVPATIRGSGVVAIMLALFALSPLCRAQDHRPSFHSVLEVFRADMQADRATIITAAMNFSDRDASTFWPIYRKYEYQRTKLDDRRAAVMEEYARKYPAITDADAKAMAEQMFECESHLATLKKRYFKELNKVLPAYSVAKFFQLDHRIDLLVEMKVESSLPPLSDRGTPNQRSDQ